MPLTGASEVPVGETRERSNDPERFDDPMTKSPMIKCPMKQ
jgi:hypothetical protein